MTTGRAQYLRGLVGSWRALAAAQPSAVLVEHTDYVAFRHPNPVLCNGLVLSATGLEPADAILAGALSPGTWALWGWDDDAEVTRALAGAGLHRDETTVAMVCDLAQVGPPETRVEVVDDPAGVAALNGVDSGVLHGVPGLRCWLTRDGDCGLAVIVVGEDANVSFVFTKPSSRRRGRASDLLRQALCDVRDEGLRTASLQATPDGHGLYQKLGFRRVGVWQEWRRPVG